ncbi:MAG: hypothetical protein R3B93_27340 [Bacteroidia bacterium]
MEISHIKETLQNLLKAHIPPLTIQTDTPENFVVTGTKEVMQGKKKVDGIYFASVVPKPKDVRFYFFPIYTHKDDIGELSPELQKFLKGKSCFHVKKLDADMEAEIAKMIQKGIEAYTRDALI